MKNLNPFKSLSKFELSLWLTSVVVVSLSYFLTPNKDYLTFLASLIGVTSLIFTAKGYVIGQVLGLIFSIFYGIIAFFFRYYGEMLTYLGMTAPIAVMSIISWIKNPYEKTKEVRIEKLTKKQIVFMSLSSILITIFFYFILKAFNTANLFFSTISVTTSFLACYLMFARNPFYALAYAANDVVLITLWILATIVNTAYLPMIFCFLMFLLNDVYAFFNWRKMEKSQRT